MSALLDDVITAHGGLDRWHRLSAIDVKFNYSGEALVVKGFPRHLQPVCTIDIRGCRVVFQGLGGDHDDRWIFTADRCWIERRDGSVVVERDDPRAAFRGHTWETKWDALHLTYFIGYAMWNYLTVPFLFAEPGFEAVELPTHTELGEVWRVLQVTYPAHLPAHTQVQKLYFGTDGLLRRLDYSADVAHGVAAHYCFDHRDYDGVLIPTLRRVVTRTALGPQITGPTGFLLDYVDLNTR